jgi:hypothetical protein
MRDWLGLVAEQGIRLRFISWNCDFFRPEKLEYSLFPKFDFFRPYFDFHYQHLTAYFQPDTLFIPINSISPQAGSDDSPCATVHSLPVHGRLSTPRATNIAPPTSKPLTPEMAHVANPTTGT